MDIIGICVDCVASSNVIATVVVAAAVLALSVGRDLARAK